MAGATNPGNIGHAWVKALWVDRVPAPGMDRPDQYDPGDYEFIHATIADNPFFARRRRNTRKRWGNCPRRCGARFSTASGTSTRGSTSIFFRRGGTRCVPSKCSSSRGRRGGFRLTGDSSIPSAVYWHATRADGVVVTYREFVQNRLSPRMLAAAIAERSVDRLGRAERIRDIFLSPDAFAQRTRGRFDRRAAWRRARRRGLAASHRLRTTIAWAAGC